VQRTSILRKCDNPQCTCDHGHGVGIAVISNKRIKALNEGTIEFCACCKVCAYSPFIKELREAKRKRTLQERYGTNNVMQIKDVKSKQHKKAKHTLKLKYGVEHPLQVKEFALKAQTNARKTWKVKYNQDINSPFKVPGAKIKAAQTILERYGDHPMRIEHLKNINHKNMLETKLKRYGSTFPNVTCHSRVATKLFDDIVSKGNLKGALYGKDEVYLQVKNKRKGYKLDFVYKDKAIEFYGDYWHCNPEVYKEGIILRNGKTSEDIYKKDKIRENFIKSKYKLLIVWESDLLSYEDTINRCLNFLLCD